MGHALGTTGSWQPQHICRTSACMAFAAPCRSPAHRHPPRLRPSLRHGKLGATSTVEDGRVQAARKANM